MCSSQRAAPPTWLGLVLAALTAILITILGAVTPSAAVASQAGTRVGAQVLLTQVVVRPDSGIDVGQSGTDRPTYDSARASGGAVVGPAPATPRDALVYGYDGAVPSYDASVRFVGARAVVQVKSVGRHTTSVSLPRRSAIGSHRSVVVSGFVVAAKSLPRSLDELSRQGAQLDRNGLTQAGRSLQKHAFRPGITAYPKVPGKQLNRVGQDVLDDMLTHTHPQAAERNYVDSKFGPVREFLLPDVGARFEQSGKLLGFL
jgi:hypothetical protein